MSTDVTSEPEPPPVPGPVAPAVIVHGGAGRFDSHLESAADAYRDGLMSAVDKARDLLERGHDAVEAAQAAVEILEDCPLFNAGVGSALCTDGTVQMSASVMRGSDGRAGGVAGITTVMNPIVAALAVFDSPQVLVIGADAERLALDRGAEKRPNEYFVTDRQRERLEQHLARATHVAAAGPPTAEPAAVAEPIAGEAHGAVADQHGTVGAVCRDTHGTLAAATSTGGVMGQPPGRVGDSPLIGAGTWADGHVAISCTGDGEAFIRAGAAARIATLTGCGVPLDEAADRVLAEIGAFGGTGGLIALDADGATVTPYTTETLLHAVWRPGTDPEVRIPPPAERAASTATNL